ncbi:type IV conjugative transfer system pilin TraA [Vibrio mediterranei]|uniref:Pilin n=1 Tax=Vibrio mediterranei TaxID=689 RepID=A0A3G4VJK8_9VIBR|nr:type IV conjugative transfer system pilin TraA [Vibrio mediterranei]
MQNLSSINKNTFVVSLFLMALTLGLAQPALAADLFATSKSTMKDTAGTGSGVEMAIFVVGALGAAVLGFTTRNWYAAVGGFAGGMIFWEVIKPLIGLA